jgi:hypothetical protein
VLVGRGRTGTGGKMRPLLKGDQMVVCVDLYEIDHFTCKHEHDDAGRHRLTVSNHIYRGGSHVNVSEWYGYQSIIVMEVDWAFFAATTEYHSNLPRVFRITEGRRLNE